MNRHGRVDIASIVLAIVVVYGCLFVRNLWPVVWTKVQVDEVAKLTLLEWRDKSERKARERMHFELNERDVPENVVMLRDSCGDWGCCLFEREKDFRHVDCWWDEPVYFPFTDRSLTLEFSVHKYLDDDDHLRDYEED